MRRPYPLATALIELLSDPGRRIAMGRAGPHRAAKRFVDGCFERDLLVNLRLR